VTIIFKYAICILIYVYILFTDFNNDDSIKDPNYEACLKPKLSNESEILSSQIEKNSDYKKNQHINVLKENQKLSKSKTEKTKKFKYTQNTVEEIEFRSL